MKILIKILVIAIVTIGVFSFVEYLFHFDNYFYSILVAIPIIILIERILKKIFGEKIDNFLNKW